MANFLGNNTEWTFDMRGKRVKLVHSTYSEVVTKADMGWYASYIKAYSSIAIAPECFTYEEVKAKFMQMLEEVKYDNVTIIK